MATATATPSHADLLFFDTFSHDSSEELNLDLVQFPKPVNVSEVRIIPLGARVQGDFPGGVRLGATNPSQFRIDFFVNNLGKPNASTFETLGGFDYSQNGQIHMECEPPSADDPPKKIPTDGLVLKGRYTTITLAVYGNISVTAIEPPPPAPVPRDVSPPPRIATPPERPPAPQPLWSEAPPDAYAPADYPRDGYDCPPYRPEYYDRDGPKDPRAYRRDGSEPLWDDREGRRSREKDRSRRSPLARGRSRSPDRGRSGERYSRSRSGDGDFPMRPVGDEGYRRDSRSPYRPTSPEKYRDRPYKRDDRRRPRGQSRERYDKGAPSFERPPYERRAPSYENREPPFDKTAPFERRYDRPRDANRDGRSRSPIRDDPRKRPRTPPMDAPRRPRTPEEIGVLAGDANSSPKSGRSPASDDAIVGYDPNGRPIAPKDPSRRGFKRGQADGERSHAPRKRGGYAENSHPNAQPPRERSPVNRVGTPADSPRARAEDGAPLDVEQFEPILSDEDICDDIGDVDYESNDCGLNDDMIKSFNPFLCERRKHRPSNGSALRLAPDVEDKKHVMNVSVDDLADLNGDFKKLLEIIRNDRKVGKYTMETFAKLPQEDQEEWVHSCEQIKTLIRNIANNTDILLRITKSKKSINVNDADFGHAFNLILEYCKIGLNYDLALFQTQPTYMTRHIRCGINLVEVLVSHKYSSDFVMALIENDVDVFVKLFELYFKEPMALSFRLTILKSIDSCLNSRDGIEYFLSSCICDHFEKYLYPKDRPNVNRNSTARNGYQMLLTMLNMDPLTRIKFSLRSLLNKLNLYELLKKFSETVTKLNDSMKASRNGIPEISESQIEFIIHALEEILYIYRNECFELSQPIRFLPVSTQFEIHKNYSNDVLFNFFEIHKMAEICLFLLTCPMTYSYPVITNPIYELFSHMSGCNEGVLYLYNNIKTSELMLKLFLQTFIQQNEEEQMLAVQDISSHSTFQYLGLELAYKLQAYYYLDIITDMSNDSYMSEIELVDKLHSLYSLTLFGLGKFAVADVLSMNDNILCFLDILEKDVIIKDKEREDVVQVKQKLPTKNYAVDLIVLTIQFTTDANFLRIHGPRILNIAKKHDLFESNVECNLQGILPYLKPLERLDTASLTLILDIFEFIKASAEHVVSIPGEITTSLRLLRHFCIPMFETKKLELGQKEGSGCCELKYKFALTQLFSLDGVTHIVGLLEKLCSYYEQPNLHTSAFVSTQGFHIAHIVLPALELLRRLLSYVIRCRNTQFKDLTAIPVILQAYSLMNSFPTSSAVSKIAQKACREAIKTLLAYTQPIADEASETESIHKSLWTLMCAEIFKYTMTAPYTFLHGLNILAELLPLPLPIQTKFRLSDTEISNIINNRKLWSAHLHTLSSNIMEMIQSMCLTICHPLISHLKRVCVQISDLAPNTSMCVVKAVLDILISNLCAEGNVLPQQLEPVNQTMARLLNFLAFLSSHASIKCTILHIIKPNATIPKSEDRYSIIVPLFVAILTTVHESHSHIQAQECILSIINSLCDTEITLLTNTKAVLAENGDESENTKSVTNDLYLANAFPSKDTLVLFIGATFDYIGSENSSSNLILPILRTYFLLTEHDYGFYHFKTCMDKNKQIFYQILNKIVGNLTKHSLECISEFLEIIKIMQTVPEDVEMGGGIHLNRSISLSIQEVADTLNWHKNKEDHPLFTLEKFLQENNVEDLLTNVRNLISSLKEFNPSQPTAENTQNLYTPPILVAESLTVQFANRTFCTRGDARDERLGSSYWLGTSLGAEDDPNDASEMTPCDITEITRQFLPVETDLLAEAERLLHLSLTQSRPPSESSMFRTKRLHVPRDTRRPYISPGRGRASLGNGGNAGAPPLTVSSRPPIDAFRSRPPNTSRPPSLHVDDFLALEGCGAQPTGPTGYNKLPMITSRMRTRGITVTDRGRFASATPTIQPPYRRGRGSWTGSSTTSSTRGDLSPTAMHYGRQSSEHFQTHSSNQYSAPGSWSPIGRGSRGSRGLRHSRSSFTR